MFDKSGIVNILDKNRNSIGTGFFINSNGEILTCIHVLKKANYSINGKVYFSYLNSIHTAIWEDSSDDNNDIAFIKSNISAETYYSLISSVGFMGKVKTYGYPNKSRIGIFAKAEVYGKITDNNDLIKLQLGNANDITLGFSGAPLLDAENHVVGVVNAIPKNDLNNRLKNVAFAIPSSVIINLFYKKIEINNDNYVSKLKSFVGRKQDISKYLKSIQNNKVTIIQGMSGVGKTSLAQILYERTSATNKIWIEIRENINNELESVLYDISKDLFRIGSKISLTPFADLKINSFEHQNNTNYEDLINYLTCDICTALNDKSIVVFIDDAHYINANCQTKQFFRNLIEKSKTSKFVFITRTPLSFVSKCYYDSNIEQLNGLNKSDFSTLINNSGVSLKKQQIKDLYLKTEGNAKILEICLFTLSKLDLKEIDSFISNMNNNLDITVYIKENIINNISNLDLKILRIISLSRKPLELSTIIQVCEEDFVSVYSSIDALVKRNIIDKTKDTYSIHSLLKEYFSSMKSIDSQFLHKRIAECISQTDYMETAYHYFSCGNYKNAFSILISNFDELVSSGYLSSIPKLLKLFNEGFNDSSYISSYNYLMGIVCETKGNYDKAICAFNKISDNNDYTFNKYIETSKCYEKKGEYNNALNNLQLLEKCIDSKDDINKSIININRGFIFCHIEKIKKGIKLCEKGLQVLANNKSVSKDLIADGYNNLCWNYIIKGDFKKAEVAISTAEKFYTNNTRGVALLNIRKARIYWQKGELKTALKIINGAENALQPIGDPQLNAFVLRQKNLIIWNIGDFEKSLLGHKESLKIYNRIKDYWGIAASLENIAVVYYDLGNYNSALQFIDDAIRICDKIKSTDFLSYAYLYKSRIESQKGNHNEAVKLSKKSIRLLTKWKYSQYYKGMAFASLGVSYIYKKKYYRAKLAFSISIYLLDQGNAMFQKHISLIYQNICSEILHNTRDNSKKRKYYQYLIDIGASNYVKNMENFEKNIWKEIINGN